MKPLGSWTGEIFSSSIKEVRDILKTVSNLLNGDFKSASKNAQSASSNLSGTLEYMRFVMDPMSSVFSFFATTLLDKVSPTFQVVGNSITEFFIETVPDAFSSFLTRFSQVCAQIDEIAHAKWQGISDWWKSSTLVQWWENDVAPWFALQRWMMLFDSIKQSLSAKWTETYQWWKASGPSRWWTADVTPWFTAKKWAELYDNIRLSLVGKWTEVTTWWNSSAIVKWWNDDVAPWFTAKKWTDMMTGVGSAFQITFKNAVNGATALVNKFISWLNDRMSFSWDAITVAGQQLAPAGHVQLFTIPNIPYLAKGGVLEQPTLAMMGEYAGAKNNPEIAAPQSVLMDTFMETLVPLLNELEEFREDVVQLLREIIAKNPNITLDGTPMARQLKPYLDEENKRVGGTIF